MSVLTDLENRGILNDKTNNIEIAFKDKNLGFYCGIDPTGQSLHIGHLIPIITLLRLKKNGFNNTFFLIGGATGMIGDPTFKSDERVFLEKELINENSIKIKNQLKTIFRNNGFDIEIVNNGDWYSKMSVIDFLREGKNITVNYMSSKESIKKRIINGISFTEFSYQLLQAYDFYYLNEKYNVNVQIGGADQWGNITSGIEFIRKKTGKQVYGFTIKLLLKPDGNKFGKTESGAIWLDKELTSPYEFFQFWINIPDEEISNVFKIFSLNDLESINELISEHNKCPQRKILQTELAKEMTAFIHGQEEMNKSLEISEILFGNKDVDCLKNIENIEKVLKNINNIEVNRFELSEVKTYYDLFCRTCMGTLFESKGNIKRCFCEKSISVNKKKVSSMDDLVDKEILNSDFILVQKGKKNYFVIFIR